MIGILSGANIGMIIAGLLAGAKRSEQSRECGWDHSRSIRLFMMTPR